MPDFTLSQWLLAIAAAAGIGISKSGFTGLGMFHVVVFATLYGAKQSTGLVLPMLIIGDVCAVVAFGRSADWRYVRKVFPPTAIGVAIGWLMMEHIDDAHYKPVIGWIILVLAIMQASRMLRPHWFSHVPHAVWFAWSLGLIAGVATMLANAAGPIVAIYLLAVSLPKNELMGTSSWFFLIINVFKLPFSATQHLIDGHTLLVNLVLAPAIVVGTLVGRKLIGLIPQRFFDLMLLSFVTLAALRLILAS